MSHEDDVYKRLVTVEPPPTDIFRVFRANHPETLAFTPPVVVTKPVPDFAPETSVTLRSGDKITEQVATLPIITGAAVVSAANRQMNEIMDINEMLGRGKWEAAEDILGRKLTLEEKQQRQILDKVAEPEEIAARELKMEALKGRLKTYHTKYKALLAKYKATREKRIKDEMDRVKKEAKAVADEFLRMAGGWDDDDDDAPGHPGFLDENNASFDSYFNDGDAADLDFLADIEASGSKGLSQSSPAPWQHWRRRGFHRINEVCTHGCSTSEC